MRAVRFEYTCTGHSHSALQTFPNLILRLKVNLKLFCSRQTLSPTSMPGLCNDSSWTSMWLDSDLWASLCVFEGISRDDWCKIVNGQGRTQDEWEQCHPTACVWKRRNSHHMLTPLFCRERINMLLLPLDVISFSSPSAQPYSSSSQRLLTFIFRVGLHH